MHDPVDPAALERFRQRGHVGEIQMDEIERARMAALDLGKAGLLQGNRVISVEVIDPDHLFAPFQQPQRRMEADEPCGSGTKPGHSSNSLFCGWIKAANGGDRGANRRPALSPHSRARKSGMSGKYWFIPEVLVGDGYNKKK